MITICISVCVGHIYGRGNLERSKPLFSPVYRIDSLEMSRMSAIITKKVILTPLSAVS